MPENGRVPGLPEWKYIPTPGHSPGHMSLFRESDSVLIAGDAFVTTKAESFLSTMVQYKKLSGPPKYFTYDWLLAKESFRKLVNLEPEIAATGHGKPVHGEALRNSLHTLSQHFYKEAVPKQGRYVNEPAIANATGVIYTPQNNLNPRSMAIKILSLTAFAAMACMFLIKEKKKIRKHKDALAYEVW